MPPWLSDILYPLIRWLHLVCTTLLVGGTLFFELVLPLSIEDLKNEQRLYVFARARHVFRWVVWISVAGLLLSGGVSLYRQWELYHTGEYRYAYRWALSHIVLSTVTLVIALLLTIGRSPPADPVRWMRLNLVILLIAIFLGSATHHFQLALRERGPTAAPRYPVDGKPPIFEEFPATSPTTRPVP